MRGILTLGRFLIWLAIFLFFYSSFMVLIQYGSKSYVPMMTGGWGSIAGEFQKSFRTLTASARASQSTETAAAPAGGAAPGAAQPGTGQPGATAAPGEAKPAEIPQFVSLLIWSGVVVSMLAFFWLVAVAFQDSMLWGLVVLFIPGGAFVYWITHFREATPPLVVGAIGSFTLFFTFTHYNIDYMDYFIGTPAPPPPKQPSPLEGMIVPVSWH